MPLLYSRLKRVDYQPVIDKLLKPLHGWKVRFFSLHGELS
jgi:hypothetical protein